MKLRDAIQNVLLEGKTAEVVEEETSSAVEEGWLSDTLKSGTSKPKTDTKAPTPPKDQGGGIRALIKKRDPALESVQVGGGATGASMVPDPTNVKAKAPGDSKTQGEPMKKIQDPSSTSVEDTDDENNAEPTGDFSARNAASVAMKGSVKEHFEAMFDGEEISESFKEKATTIFEMAVNYKVNEISEELEAVYEAKLNETIEQIEENYAQQVVDLTEKLDEYLNYVVEQWVEQNEIAIEKSLRTEITEEFMEGLKNLFAEHYIDVPQDKVDVVEELALRVEELEAQLNDTINENIQLKSSIDEMESLEIVNEITEDLTESQIEKFKKLIEGVEFDDVDDFKKKITIVKENYFPSNGSKKATRLLEESFDGEEPATVASGAMSKYVSAISRTTVR